MLSQFPSRRSMCSAAQTETNLGNSQDGRHDGWQYASPGNPPRAAPDKPLTLVVPRSGWHDHRFHFWCDNPSGQRTMAELDKAGLTRRPGTVNIFRYGAGPNGIMRTLGQYMLGSGATFGYVCVFRQVG
jgi:hypothetical protein